MDDLVGVGAFLIGLLVFLSILGCLSWFVTWVVITALRIMGVLAWAAS